MSEVRRVYRKKTFLFLLVLSVVNFALFLFSAAPDKKITLSGDELTQYISSYPGFLARTAESGHTLAALNMYKKGYAFEVLQKSTAAYEKLEGIMPRGGDNRGIVLLLQYRITDLFLLAFLLILSADFLAERKKGLVGMVRSTWKGRGDLFLYRIAILAFSAFLGALLLYGGNYLGMLLAFGKSDLSRCIQSLPEFMKCPYGVTIGQYFLLLILFKALGCFAAAAAFLIFISLLGTFSAYAGMALLTVLEITLHALIVPVSSLNILRYLNLYTIISCEECFTDYCFINLFGRAVSSVTGMLVFLILLSLLFAGVGFYIHSRCYVSNLQLGERILNRLALFREKMALQRSLPGWEAYKLFVKQGGILILLVVFALHFYMSTRYAYSYPVDAYETLMYLKYEGEVTEESYRKVEREMDMLKERIRRYNKKLTELQMEKPVDSNKVNAMFQSLADLERMRSGLQPVLDDMRGGIQYMRRTGRTVWLVQPFTYEILLLKDDKTRDRASLLILIGIIGAVSGVFAFDTENHMKDSIHTAYRGRRHTAAIKLLMVFLACAAACVSLHLIQIYQISGGMGLNNLAAPVQSLSFMRGFGPYVSILGYLVLLFAVRTAVAYGVGLLCALVSRFSRDTVTALGISAFLFVVPTVFAEIIPGAGHMSAIYLLGGSWFKGAEVVAEEEPEPVSEWAYVPEYRELEFPGNYYTAVQAGDFLYYEASRKSGDQEDAPLMLCKYSILDGSTENIVLDTAGSSINCLAVADDGNIYAVVHFLEEIGEQERTAEEDDGEEDRYRYWLSLTKFGADGSSLYETELTEVLEKEENAYISAIAVDGEGRAYLACGTRVFLFEASGRYAGDADLGGMMGSRITSMGKGKDGKVYASYGSFIYSLVEIDFDRKKAGKIYDNFLGGSGSNLSVGTEKDFLIQDGSTVYEYDCEAENSEALFQWLDCDIDGSFVRSLGLLSDGRVAALSHDWDTNEDSLTLLTRKHASEVAQRETLVLATMSYASELRAAAVEFNRTNERYRISVREYWNYNSYRDSWGDAVNTLNTDILSGDCPDILDLSSLDAESMAAQGLLEDMGPYLDRSAVLKREDFVDHTLEGNTYNGLLAGVPKKFTVQTVVGRASDVGRESGWKMDDMIALSDARPDAQLFDYATKWNVMYSCLNYNQSEFINWETGECSFNTPEFVRMLEFANRFADKVDYNSEESPPVRIQRGDVLLGTETISSFKDAQMYKAVFGGDITFVGYPTPDGSPGCEMHMTDVYGIPAKSEKKEAAWSFIEFYLSRESKSSLASWGFPTSRKQLQDQWDEELEIKYRKDENGEIVLDDNGDPIPEQFYSRISYQDGWTYDYRQSTREETEQIMELIRAARPNITSYSEIISIVNEEAGYFFNGARSAEGAAEIIQKRVQLYVNENRKNP